MGVAFMGKVLAQKLAESGAPEAAEAAKIVDLVNQSIKMTRELARGLLPVVPEAQGLMSGLSHWSAEISDLFHVNCRFRCGESVSIHDEVVADHLYRLAQEAVMNAIKHGTASEINIGLSVDRHLAAFSPSQTTVPASMWSDAANRAWAFAL